MSEKSEKMEYVIVAEMFRLFVGLDNVHMALDRIYGDWP